MQPKISRNEEIRHHEQTPAEIIDNRNRATKISDVGIIGHKPQSIYVWLCSRKEKAKLENLDRELKMENVAL